MNAPAAIQGDYVDLRFIKSRKVCQVVIEIPIEAGETFVAAFGTPNPSTGVPVALARIDPNAKAAPETKTDKAKRKWDELSIAQRAGIVCEEGGFRTFLKEEYGDEWEISNGDAASVVRHLCMVKSRSELDHEPLAGKRFNELDSEYRTWLRVPA